ncbi:pyrroline-5-carboxylate reductase [Methylobacterium sp. Leaf102]|uniref:pyrroline-5-carboxylate reductase n=1 Tax=unclassified Methylobacterium TaxID=2615210 RepID=UPI0006FEB4C9|nr:MULTISPECIES: pyrroline-5-carboxylate reductase [unclassified Methylobacterium]KQO69420.1 pyrroline-5-carboxylate reductase [Methylobacterium sp. Leaf87]KQP34495.1 pyrroline-5-carboxylate reductase [Methylobacterium sp. Leaf102]
MNRLPASLTLVGAGKMGGAMLAGWLAGGLDAARTTVLDPHPSPEVEALCATRGLALNPATVPASDALVLAMKPQGLDTAAPMLAGLADARTLVVSILAGKTIADLQARLPRVRAIVRAMPNLPASIGRGATGAVASAGTEPSRRVEAEALLASVGSVEWLDDEGLLDALTAVSGSGPAYVFLLAEAMAQAGVAAGLPADMAARLARATVAGAGALLDATDRDAGLLRQDVTSPGGTTAAALAVLMRDGGVSDLLREAVAAGRHRAGELSG